MLMGSFVAKVCALAVIVLSAFSLPALAQKSSAEESSQVNHPPKIAEIQLANPQVHRGVDMQLIPVAEDPEGDQIRFSYQWYINGVEVEGNNTAVLPGDQFRRGDRISVMVTPTDDRDTGPTFATKEVVIPNASPSVSMEQVPSIVDNRLDYQVVATDPDGDPLTFTLAGGPPGMTIHEQTGRISWTRQNGQEGQYDIDIVVSDGVGGQTSVMFTMTLQ